MVYKSHVFVATSTHAWIAQPTISSTGASNPTATTQTQLLRIKCKFLTSMFNNLAIAQWLVSKWPDDHIHKKIEAA